GRAVLGSLRPPANRRPDVLALPHVFEGVRGPLQLARSHPGRADSEPRITRHRRADGFRPGPHLPARRARGALEAGAGGLSALGGIRAPELIRGDRYWPGLGSTAVIGVR